MKKLVRALLLMLLLASVACGGEEEEGFTETTAREAFAVFPSTEWVQATPASQGIDPVKLQAAVSYLKANAPFDGVNELVIVRNGYLIWKGSNIDKRHGIWSATKSFTSTVLGLLVADGRTTLDTKVATYLPGMAARYPGVTFRHLATMTSGYFAVGDTTASHSASRTPFSPSTPLFTPPGSKFAYWDSAMNQLANALTRVAAEPIEQLFKRRIADPIGMKSADWDWGDWGAVNGLVVNGGAGNASRHIFITARQLARFGLLMLNRGRWNGKQLISATWVDAATRAQVPSGLPQGSPIANPTSGSGVYGFNWWTNNGQRMWPGVPASAYSAAGYNNNKMMIVPDWNLVVVRMGLDGGSFGIKNSVYASFLQKIGAAITGSGTGYSDAGTGGTGGGLAATSFTLINSASDAPIRTLSSGGVIRLAQDGTRLNVRANVSGSAGSVKLVLAGSFSRVENAAPYALAGDSAGNYGDWTPALGMHTLTATPYSAANAGGVAGAPLTITFSVTSN